VPVLGGADGGDDGGQGWVECVGHADRSCFDLEKHGERTETELVAQETLAAPVRPRSLSVCVSVWRGGCRMTKQQWKCRLMRSNDG
jgi:glycyl-tRNA synthetase (class II)